jgi:hypothetical protein
MRKVKISLDDLLVVLESMKETGGTQEITFFEYNGMPAICDSNDPDNIITFQSVNEAGEVNEDDETVH